MPNRACTHHGSVNSTFRNTAPSRRIDLRTSESASMGFRSIPAGPRPIPACGRCRYYNVHSLPKEMRMKTHEGACICGSVQFTVTGEPVAMGYCHCESCRRWSAAPVNAFTLWKPDALRITRGADRVYGYQKTPNSF